MIQLVRGFKDILPEEATVWQYIEQIARGHFESFGFNEIRPPVLEQAALFRRSIGEHTDIVEKEMYTFPGSKGNLLTLRPEATASVVRAYIQHKLYASDPVQKLYTIGPMFRKERPQKGRYRQFHQINAEVFGIDSPYMDAHLIFMLVRFFERLAVDSLRVHLNSLGCPECRTSYKEALTAALSGRAELLCSDCVRRLDKNPLRLLDCKVPGCREEVAHAPEMADFLCGGCREHFETVKSGLAAMGVAFQVDPRLVRGLDYYTRTAFEIQTDELGAQSAIAGGGRYDGLVEQLGGPSMPAIGFAVGTDRLAELILSRQEPGVRRPAVFFAAMGEAAWRKSFKWACALSDQGIRVEIDYSDRSLKALMRRADRLRAKYVLIVGDRELAENTANLRHMASSRQLTVPADGLVEAVTAELSAQSQQ